MESLFVWMITSSTIKRRLKERRNIRCQYHSRSINPVCNDLDDKSCIRVIEDDGDLIFTYAFIEKPWFFAIEGQYIEV